MQAWHDWTSKLEVHEPFSTAGEDVGVANRNLIATAIPPTITRRPPSRGHIPRRFKAPQQTLICAYTRKEDSLGYDRAASSAPSYSVIGDEAKAACVARITLSQRTCESTIIYCGQIIRRGLRQHDDNSRSLQGTQNS